MRTKNVLTLVLVFSILSLPFAGCKKAWDTISNGPGKELKMCNIKKLIAPNNDWEEAYFTYNQWGNPEKVIMKKTNTGSPNYFFKYDNKQRLILFMNNSKKELVNGDEVAFERFRYNADGSVDDTGEIWYGIYKDGEVQESGSTSNYQYHIEFDTKGRVSKVSSLFDQERFKTLYYNYDSKGNLMYPKEDGVEYMDLNKDSYDNNVNFLRTNKVWMFLNRDYSMNNKYSTSGVSCYGLPTGFTSDKDRNNNLKFYQTLFGTHQNQMGDYTQIEYMCDCGTGSSK